MGTLLLIFFIFFIVIPIVRIAVAAYTVRRKMRDAMRQMYDAQQRAQRGSARRDGRRRVNAVKKSERMSGSM